MSERTGTFGLRHHCESCKCSGRKGDQCLHCHFCTAKQASGSISSCFFMYFRASVFEAASVGRLLARLRGSRYHSAGAACILRLADGGEKAQASPARARRGDLHLNKPPAYVTKQNSCQCSQNRSRRVWAWSVNSRTFRCIGRLASPPKFKNWRPGNKQRGICTCPGTRQFTIWGQSHVCLAKRSLPFSS